MFRKILIANRGEIAVRVIRACREMGITAVAVYSEADREALHVRLADEAYPIGPPAPGESYLAIPRIIEAAKRAGAEAIHPGYGFLSENPHLPEACAEAGLVFIGPGAAAMRLMGNKVRAREAMVAAGVPVTPGTAILPENAEAARAEVEGAIAEAVEEASRLTTATLTSSTGRGAGGGEAGIDARAGSGVGAGTGTRSKSENPVVAATASGAARPSPSQSSSAKGNTADASAPRSPSAQGGGAASSVYPVLLKAAAGGGGKGMRVVASSGEFASAYAQARSEASSSFGDPSVYAEKYVTAPRHIEIQVLADTHGTVLHLGERECTIQRRHQKLIEESPSPVVDAALRERLGALAVTAARAAGYVGAGTCEFLRDADGSYYFMEMNARLQVEHPVTEMVTGLDLVKLQIRIAAGEKLALQQERLAPRGWAIECRIFAEDPARGFMPSPGRIGTLRIPAGPGIRDDGGVYQGYRVPVHYDPMISKLIAWGESREEAIARMRRALDEYRIEGVRTTIPFHRRVMRHPAFIAGDLDTSFIERYRGDLIPQGGDAAARTSAIGTDAAGSGDPLSTEEVAVVAAAIAAFRKAELAAAGAGGALEGSVSNGQGVAGHSAGRLRRGGDWKLAARLAGLRTR
jgi:acetyl/propionyl-CoA carboxylase alpha subunit